MREPKNLLQPYTKQHYFAFLLDAFDRYLHEGRDMKLVAAFAQMLGIKTTGSFMACVAASMAKIHTDNDTSNDLIAEFGVYKGRSLRHLSRLFPKQTIYGFDSFEGFPDDGRNDWRKDLSVAGLPEVPANVQLVKGFFEKTLPAFESSLASQAKVRLLHIDCDIYSSTRTILTTLANRMQSGSVLVFDELINYNGFVENEFLALYEFLLDNNLDFEWFVKMGKVLDLLKFCQNRNSNTMADYRKNGFFQCAAIQLIKADNMHNRLMAYARQAKELADNHKPAQELSHTYQN